MLSPCAPLRLVGSLSCGKTNPLLPSCEAGCTTSSTNPVSYVQQLVCQQWVSCQECLCVHLQPIQWPTWERSVTVSNERALHASPSPSPICTVPGGVTPRLPWLFLLSRNSLRAAHLRPHPLRRGATAAPHLPAGGPRRREARAGTVLPAAGQSCCSASPHAPRSGAPHRLDALDTVPSLCGRRAARAGPAPPAARAPRRVAGPAALPPGPPRRPPPAGPAANHGAAPPRGPPAARCCWGSRQPPGAGDQSGGAAAASVTLAAGAGWGRRQRALLRFSLGRGGGGGGGAGAGGWRARGRAPPFRQRTMAAAAARRAWALLCLAAAALLCPGAAGECTRVRGKERGEGSGWGGAWGGGSGAAGVRGSPSVPFNNMAEGPAGAESPSSPHPPASRARRRSGPLVPLLAEGSGGGGGGAAPPSPRPRPLRAAVVPGARRLRPCFSCAGARGGGGAAWGVSAGPVAPAPRRRAPRAAPSAAGSADAPSGGGRAGRRVPRAAGASVPRRRPWGLGPGGCGCGQQSCALRTGPSRSRSFGGYRAAERLSSASRPCPCCPVGERYRSCAVAELMRETGVLNSRKQGMGIFPLKIKKARFGF